VHEKTDIRGTWAFDSVDGWYLYTSPKYYHTHNCHIKHTKSEQLSDTVQFQHKRITNPTITHADKVMLGLADCVKALQCTTSSTRESPAAQNLQQIIDATQTHVKARPNQFKDTSTPSVTPHMQCFLKVQTPPYEPTPHIDNNRRILHSMLTHTPVPRIPSSNGAPPNIPTDSTKQERKRKQQAVRLCNTATPISTSPPIRTRAQVATAAAQVAPPSMSTHSQSSVPPPSRQPGFVVAVMRQQWNQRGIARLTRRITRLDSDVHQAMTVMDADTGKLLNYRQLMRITKYRQAWSISSANEFGRLANGIGGRMKNPTNTIKFIFQHKIPTEQMKDIMYGLFVCTVRPEKAEPNRARFTVGGERINYPGKVATPTVEMLVAKFSSTA